MNQTRISPLFFLILLLTILIGCSKQLQPIYLLADKEHIYKNERNHTCMSDFYMNEVLKVRIDPK